MKKFFKLFFLTVAGFGLLIVLDILAIKFLKMPIIAREIETNCNCSDRIYEGMFYKAYYCSYDNELYIYGTDSKFTCPQKTKASFIIIDKTEVCAQALEEVYRDDQYIYYFSCIKSDNVFIKFSNDENLYGIKYVLNNDMLTIDELIENGLDISKKINN